MTYLLPILFVLAGAMIGWWARIRQESATFSVHEYTHQSGRKFLIIFDAKGTTVIPIHPPQ